VTSAPRATRIKIERVPGAWAVARLEASAALPTWAAASAGAAFVSITRTDQELSIVASEAVVPSTVRAERSLALWRVAGPLSFEQVGVLARLTVALADAGISVLAIATFDTDYLLMRVDRSADAAKALAAAGVTVLGGETPGGRTVPG